MENYLIDIGLEVHVELATKTKMFCGCPVVDTSQSKPNSAVCPVCLGMPGALPVINKRAVEYAIRTAAALSCQISESSIFARKNYFYPDLPKGYQISQFEQPLAVNGHLSIRTSEGMKEIRVRRAHLEEDAGKLSHLNQGGKSYSLVDLNRAGVPLLEIVSEPDMHSVEDVRAYSNGLRNLLRYIEVTSGDMEKGAIRFEANLSLRPAGSATLGTRVEIKNLNSFRAMEQAILYQIKQQTALLRSGGKVLQQTLGWNESKGQTQAQRSKEEANDYRYFPEPDLPPLIIEKEWLNQVLNQLPELPFARAERFQRLYEIPAQDIERLVEEKALGDYFEACLQASDQITPKTYANWILGELSGWMNEYDQKIKDIKVAPSALAELLMQIQLKKINQNTAKDVLARMLSSGQSAVEIITGAGLEQVSDLDSIQQIIRSTIHDHPDEVKSYLAGKETLVNWFFGQVMQTAKGKAEPALVKKELERTLSQLKQDHSR